MITAQHLKTEGQQLSLFNDGQSWVETMMAAMQDFCAHCKTIGRHKFLFEAFRKYAENMGYPLPPSHKAWGSLPRVAVKRGLIESTGEYCATTSLKTHGHPALVWRAL
jgi:hypothetical protein